LVTSRNKLIYSACSILGASTLKDEAKRSGGWLRRSRTIWRCVESFHRCWNMVVKPSRRVHELRHDFVNTWSAFSFPCDTLFQVRAIETRYRCSALVVLYSCCCSVLHFARLRSLSVAWTWTAARHHSIHLPAHARKHTAGLVCTAFHWTGLNWTGPRCKTTSPGLLLTV
jgi:hypothetical protein